MAGREMPWHAQARAMRAQGVAEDTIAKRLGLHVRSVRDLFREHPPARRKAVLLPGQVVPVTLPRAPWEAP